MSGQSEQHHEGFSRRTWGVLIAAGTWLVLFLAQLGESSPLARYLEQLESKSLDLRFQLREEIAPTEVDDSIVVLTIDQHGIDLYENASLLAEARGGDPEGDISNDLWPWKRAVYGLAATYLKERGARAVFFDFLFTGNSVYDWEGFGFDGDSNPFAKSCREAGNVYHSLYFESVATPKSGAAEGSTPPELDPALATHLEIVEAKLKQGEQDPLQAALVELPPSASPEYDAVHVPIPPLVDGAAGVGAVNADFDSDGVIRRTQLLYRFRGKTYGSIALSLARDLLQAESIERSADGGHLELGAVSIPVDSADRMLLNWHGPEESYDTGPLHRVLSDARNVELKLPTVIPDEEFRDKVVFIGTSAVGLADLKSTPFSRNFPGVEILATALDNIKNGDFLARPAAKWRHLFSLLLFLFAGQLFTRKNTAASSSVLAIAMLGLTLGAGIWVFMAHTIWLDLVLPGVGLVLIIAQAQTVQYFTEGRQKRQIRGVFQRYLPPEVVNEVLKVPIEDLKLGGERKELTVYFSDIEGFTSISEDLEPEQLVSMLNVYLSEMSDIVSRSGGTLDKYIGDCIMAFWGAPLPTSNGAVQACLAALENQEQLALLRERFVEQGLPAIHARIGINTGQMLVGNMGSDQHFSYTVMGDAVNLASRLEGANKQYGTYLMLGETTYERAKDEIEVRPLDLVKVKGKSQPVRVYELMARKGGLDEAREQLRKRYCAGLEFYRSLDWQAALERFQSALEIDPTDGPSQTYIKRCEHFASSPPPTDWDGVFTMTTK